MDIKQITALQDVHVTAWNEKDAAKRTELLESIYSADIKLYDKDFIIEGLKSVSDFIGKLISEDPAYHFAAAKPMELVQDGARFYGHINTGARMLNSMDFFLIEDGKVKDLYVFMEPAR